MIVYSLDIPEIKMILMKKHIDNRGFFSETFNYRLLKEKGIDAGFVQDNHSLSIETGTIRGLHFQVEPMAQGKLVRVIRGSILDVAVDMRKGSPTFGKYVVEELTEEKWNALYIPVGFAHGFLTTEPNTEVLYKTTNYYSPEHERGIIWNDPQLNIQWGVEEVKLSKKDTENPTLLESQEYFTYGIQ